MSDAIIGRGIIEVIADARQLKAGIADAKKAIRTLGEGQTEVSKSAQRSIDAYIGRLQTQSQTIGKSTRETELFKLALRGASNEQLNTANTALRVTEAHKANEVSLDALKVKFLAFALATGEVFRETIKHAIEFEASTTRLEAVFKNLGTSAGLSLGEIGDLGESLSKSTQFDDTSLRNAASQILIFGKIHGETFKEALKVSTDLAAFMGTDVVSAAHEVAAAMADPERATKLLKAAGVVLTDQQKDQLKHMIAVGNEAGSNAIVLGRLKGAFDGIAKAMNTGAIKATADLSKAWGNLLEEFGKTSGAGGPGFISSLITQPLIAAREILKDIQVQTEANKHAAGGPVSGKIGGPGAAANDRIVQLQDVIDKNTPSAESISQAASQKAARDAINKIVDAALIGPNLSAQKDALDKSKSQLDRFFAEDLVSASLFYQDRRDIVQRGLNIELASIKEGIAAQEKIFKEGKTQQEIAGAFVELAKLSQQRIAVQRSAADQLQALAVEETKGQRAFNAEIKNTIADLAQLQGRAAEAVAIRFDVSHADQLRNISMESASPNPARAADAKAQIERIAQIREATVAQEVLNQTGVQYSRVLDELSIRQERITLAVQTGNRTQLEGLADASLANRERVADLTAIVAKYDEIAARVGTPDAILAAQKLRLELEKVVSQQNLVADKFREIGTSAFENFLNKATSGTATLKDALKSLFTDLSTQIDAVVHRNLAEQLFGKQGAASGFGDFLANFLGAKAQGSAPVEERSLAGALTGSVTGVAGAAAADTALVALGATTTVADASIATLAATVTASDVVLTTLAASAGLAAAALDSVAASSAVSSGGGAIGAAGGILDSFADGTDFVPQTGIYMLHRGETVTPEGRRGSGGGSFVMNLVQNFPETVTQATRNQSASQAGVAVRRAMARQT